MAEHEKLEERIREIAGRKKNVRLSEIERVVNSLEASGYSVRRPRNEHQVVFIINGTKFSVCTHKRGSSQLKVCYVNQFLGAMMELGLYDD